MRNVFDQEAIALRDLRRFVSAVCPARRSSNIKVISVLNIILITSRDVSEYVISCPQTIYISYPEVTQPSACILRETETTTISRRDYEWIDLHPAGTERLCLTGYRTRCTH
jgi:hypothetical protein